MTAQARPRPAAEPRPARPRPGRRAAEAGLLALPAALTVLLSFNAGGFFVGATALAAIAVALVLVARVALAEDPFGGLSRSSIAAGAFLALLAAWTLVSASWSGALGRALVELDQTLLYLLLLLLFGGVVRTRARLQLLVRTMAVALLAVCAVALTTRLLPDVWPTEPNVANDRLSYPVTYWNALALLAALGIVLCTHLASSEREPRTVRVAGAAALPILVTTLYFTFSRAVIVAAVVAVVAYLVLGRPRGAAGALLAALAPVGFSLVFAYRADLLATFDPTTPAAVSQGHTVAVAVGVATLGAALLRWACLPLDAWIARSRPATRIGRRGWLALGSAGAVTALAAALALGAPGGLARQYERFVEENTVRDTGDFRERLTSVGNNGRIHEWRLAIDAFEDEPLTGHGAGTYQLLWARDRPADDGVVDGHSLYLEILSELGVVGLVLVLAALLTVLAGLATLARGPDRATGAALFAAALAWVLHAGVDWDWEMPVTAAWLFAAGGLALARSSSVPPSRSRPRELTRAATGVAVLALAVLPALMAVSQLRLDQSVRAFKRGDCAAAIEHARESRSAIGARPEPFEVLGSCYTRLGSGPRAVAAMEDGLERDPDSWELRHGLAVARAAAGLDPRADAAIALRLNPRERVVREAVERFRTSEPGDWPGLARRVALPLELSPRRRGRTAAPGASDSG